jgi:RNA polymerase sigma-70 factor (ECF subfamily)
MDLLARPNIDEPPTSTSRRRCSWTPSAVPNDRRSHVTSTTPIRQAVRLGEVRPLPDTDDDAALLAGLCTGDERAFARLIDLYQSSMMRVARAYVSTHATAEDVVQETLLAVFEGIDRFGGRSSLKTWMFRILTNRAKTAGQRERRCRPDTARAMGDDGPSVPRGRFLSRDEDAQWAGHWKHEVRTWGRAGDEAVVDAEAARIVHAEIARLPTTQRLVVVLRDAEGWSAAEVCQVLELSESNQRVLLHRGRSTVRHRLESHYAAESADDVRSAAPLDAAVAD